MGFRGEELSASWSMGYRGLAQKKHYRFPLWSTGLAARSAGFGPSLA